MEDAASATDCVILFANIPDSKTASDMAKGIIARNMAATISLLPDMTTYRYSKKHEDVKKKYEILMIIKTRKSLVENLSSYISLKCPYPDDKVDITSVSILDGNRSFLKWIFDTSNFGVDLCSESSYI